jgi:plastocyanin domain-containing protein
MDKLLVTLTGLASITFVYWFFLMRKETSVVVSGSVDITVDGGYSPEVITVKKGKAVTLNFLRKDPSNCLDEVVLPDFKTRKELPLGSVVPVTIIPEKTGVFTYSCGMNMFHGTINVVE